MTYCTDQVLGSLDSIVKSRFLDRNEQFAKRFEFVTIVRLIYKDDRKLDLTLAEFRSLSKEVRTYISELESI